MGLIPFQCQKSSRAATKRSRTSRSEQSERGRKSTSPLPSKTPLSKLPLLLSLLVSLPLARSSFYNVCPLDKLSKSPTYTRRREIFAPPPRRNVRRRQPRLTRRRRTYGSSAIGESHSLVDPRMRGGRETTRKRSFLVVVVVSPSSLSLVPGPWY